MTRSTSCSKIEAMLETGVSNSPKKSKYNFTLLQWILLVLLAINVLVLYVLHFNHDAHAVQVDASLFGRLQNVPRDTVVGFAENGELERGVGTSVYLDQGTLPHEKMSHLFLAKASDRNLMLYKQNDKDSVLTSFKVDAADLKITITPPSDANTIKDATPYGLVSLSASSQLLLVKDASAGTSTENGFLAHLVPLTGNGELRMDKKLALYTFSLTTMISRLSDSSFVLMYYEYINGKPVTDKDWAGPRKQVVQIGTVDVNGNVALSTGKSAVGTQNEHHTEFGAAVAVSGSEFIVPWYVTLDDEQKYDMKVDSGLCLDGFRVDSTNTAIHKTQSCTKAHQPVYHIGTAATGPRSMAAVFFDSHNNYALTLVTAEWTDAIHFRSSIVVDASAGYFEFGIGEEWYTSPQIQVTENGHIVLMYQHAAKKGRPVVRIFKVNDAHDLEAVSSSIPLSSDKYSIVSDEKYKPNTMFLGLLSTSASEIVGGYLSGAEKRVSVIQMKSSPVGVVAQTGERNVVMDGLVQTKLKLEAGRVYYSTTLGELVPGPFAGHLNGGRKPSDMVPINENLFVSHLARVGVALNENTIRLD